MSTLDFRFMASMFRIRDLLQPRGAVLEEAAIQPGSRVLDYGCGPGSYLAPLAKLVGPTGRIYALDVNPLALEMVKRLAARKKIVNVQTILSDCATGLADESVNIVLLYDTFHDLARPGDVLQELRRVLTPDGLLSFSDHHLREDEIKATVTGAGSFELLAKGKKTYSFKKARD